MAEKYFNEAMAEAVKFAENNKRNHGVLSLHTTNPSKVVQDSVNNNMIRFGNGDTPAPWINERPARFVDFMQKRWAPDNAPNDPTHLNKNWAPNVRWYPQNRYPDQYEQWKALNLVQAPQDGTIGVA